MQYAKKVITSHPDLFIEFKPLHQLTYEFTVDEPALVEVSGHIDCAHRGLSGTTDKAVMVAFIAQLTSTLPDGTTQGPAAILGSKTGCNIYNRTDHYAIIPIAFSVEVPAGAHTITILGRSASSAAPNTNGLAEVKDGYYNCVTYKVTELSAFSQ